MPSSIQSSHHPLTQSSAQSRIEHGLNCAHEFQTSIYLFIQLSLFVLLTTYLKSQHTREEWCKLNGEGGWENSWKTEGNGWITASAIGKCNLKTKCEREGKGQVKRNIKWRANNSTSCKYLLQQFDQSQTRKKKKYCQWKIWSARAILPLSYFFFSLLSTFDRSNEADFYFLPQLFQVPHSKT